MRIAPLAAVTLTLIAVGSVAQGAGPHWSVGPGGTSARDGRSSLIGPRSATPLWSGGRPTAFAQQGVIDGQTFYSPRTFNISDPLNGTLIVAQDLATGAERWATGIPIDFPATDWRSRVTGARDGRVYATRAGNTNASFLYALNAATGGVLWRSAARITESTTEGVVYAPDGDLITTGQNALVRINAEDGATVWSTPRTCPTTGGCDPAVYAPANRVYVWEAGAQGPVVTAFNLATGARLYSTPGIGGGFVQQNALFVGPDGTVYAPRTQNNAVSDFFVAFTDTGSGFVERWRLPQGFIAFGSFGVGPDGSVYTYNPAREIVRLDPATGAVLNTSPFSIGGQFNSPRMAIDRLGNLYVTNPDASGGTLWSFRADLSLRWSVPAPNINVGGPALGRLPAPGGIHGVLVISGPGTDIRAYRTACPGDGTGDGLIDFADLNRVLSDFGQPASTDGPTGDVNGDGLIDFADLNETLSAFGTSC